MPYLLETCLSNLHVPRPHNSVGRKKNNPIFCIQIVLLALSSPQFKHTCKIPSQQVFWLISRQLSTCRTLLAFLQHYLIQGAISCYVPKLKNSTPEINSFDLSRSLNTFQVGRERETLSSPLDSDLCHCTFHCLHPSCLTPGLARPRPSTSQALALKFTNSNK